MSRHAANGSDAGVDGWRLAFVSERMGSDMRRECCYAYGRGRL